MMLRTLACTAVLLAATTPGCSRRPAATPAPRVATQPARAPSVAARGEESAAREREQGESRAGEVMERVREVSPFAPTEAGLTELFREVVAARARGDRARLEALVRPLAPAREPLALVLTFEGGRALAPYLLAQPGAAPSELLARAEQQWPAGARVEVTSATGAELAQGAPAASALDPGMRAIAQYLRPLVRFYRVALRGPGPQDRVAVETLVYGGGRWMLVPEPWRMAPGSPARATVDPSAAWTLGTRVELPPSSAASAADRAR